MVAIFFSCVALPVSAQQLPETEYADVPQLINRYALGSGLEASEAAILKRIASCESGYRAKAQNGRFKGIFQMGDREFNKFGEGSPFNVHENIKAAIRYYQVSGTKPWSCK